MAHAHQIANGDSTESVTVIPCDCGDCTGTTVIVEKRSGRKVRRLELTFNAASLRTLQDMLDHAQASHADKGGERDWSPCDLDWRKIGVGAFRREKYEGNGYIHERSSRDRTLLAG